MSVRQHVTLQRTFANGQHRPVQFRCNDRQQRRRLRAPLLCLPNDNKDAKSVTNDVPSVTVNEKTAPRQERTITVEVLPAINEVKADEWNKCATGSGDVNPFLRHEFLNALEESGSVSRYTGWLPQHLVARSSMGTLLGCCPVYLKSHSYGEYVFDHSWAQTASYLGHHYYPKLQCCVPFTPVPGPRLLVGPDGDLGCQVLKALTIGLKALADEYGVSSLHVTFNDENTWNLLKNEGFLCRMGMQYHWENKGYSSFDDFLMELKQSKRKSIRQERKCVEKAGLTVKRLRGDDIKPHHWDRFFEFYRNTCDRKWGEAYLRRAFFKQLGETMSDHVILVIAENPHRGPVAGALNLVGSNTLYGRNWGKRSSVNVKHLHFELCYYQAIEAAIEMGLERVEAGAQGEHKIQRGYLPQPTFSSHYVRIPELQKLLVNALKEEQNRMYTAIEDLIVAASPFKKEQKNG